MSPFDTNEQFPTLKPLGRALIRFCAGMILIPARGIRRRYKPILAVIAVLVIAHGVATFVLGRQVQMEIMSIRSDGNPTTTADLAGEKIPDEENAAVLYRKAFELMSTEQGEEDLGVIGTFVSRRERAKDPTLWSKAAEVLPRYQGVISLIEQAQMRPKCRFPVNWGLGFNAQFRHLAPMRRLAQLLRAQALIDAKAGRTDEALRSTGLAFRLSDSLKDEPTLISQLVRIAVVGIAARTFTDVLEYGSVDETQARRLYGTLSGINMHSSMVTAIRGERALGIRAFQEVRKNSPSGQSLQEAAGLLLIHTWIWRPMLYADEMHYLRRVEAAVHRASLPYREFNEHPSPFSNQDPPRYAFLSGLVMPVYTRARSAADRAQASINGTQIELALQAYKDRYGSYPANLKGLRARLEWPIPEDPFSDKDFVYKRRGNGILLYSIGENLKDDGARKYPSYVTRRGEESVIHEYQTADGQFSDDVIWEMDH